MTENRKKNNERCILESFLDSLGSASPGPASAFIDSESPDFLMGKEKPSPLGIEILRLTHKPDSSKKIPLSQEEGIQDRLCKIIRGRWNKRIPAASVHLVFFNHNFPRQHEEDGLVDELLNVIEINMPEIDQKIRISRGLHWKNSILGLYISSITIRRWGFIDEPHVSSPRATFLPPLSHDYLQNAFTKKNPKVVEYRKKCQEVWLVAAHGLSMLSTHFLPYDSVSNDSYTLDFDRAFVLDVMSQKVVEIRKQYGSHLKV